MPLKLFQGIKCVDSSASDSKKEITCTTYFSKLSEKNNYHILVNILLHVCFITFPMCKDLKETQTQCLVISSIQS